MWNKCNTFLFRISNTSLKNRSNDHIRCWFSSNKPASRGVTNCLRPALNWQWAGKFLDHSIWPFSDVCVPEMTPDVFFVVIKCIVSLFLRPPNGRNGKLPVATWYNVTPIDQRSMLAVNVFEIDFRRTALSYKSGCKYSSVPYNETNGWLSSSSRAAPKSVNYWSNIHFIHSFSSINL